MQSDDVVGGSSARVEVGSTAAIADAVVAAAAMLHLVAPMKTGTGGDVFAVVYLSASRMPAGARGAEILLSFCRNVAREL
jgi:hypothetical protein